MRVFLLTLLISASYATTVVVELSRSLSTDELSKIGSQVELIELLDNYPSEYFQRLYLIKYSNETQLSKLFKDVEIKQIEGDYDVEAATILPADNSVTLSSDIFSYLQWGLFNQGQRVVKDKDLLTSYEIVGEQGSDIGITPKLSSFDDHHISPLVAVIDSGVDYNHPDLKDRIQRNYLECNSEGNPMKSYREVIFDKDSTEFSLEDGYKVTKEGFSFLVYDLSQILELEKEKEFLNTKFKSPFVYKDINSYVVKDIEVKAEDIDRNTYPGDCVGWNFTTNLKSDPEARDTMDYNGHGTHVSGIIAAQIDNAIGIRGVTNKVKILPIKVYKQEEFMFEQRGLSKTTLFARAILYAIKKKVSIINISGAWPRENNTVYLQNTVNEALSKGIVIVAAAGNNRSQESTFPCAQTGVLCVGSISPDGSMSSFSNYGGYVDVLAPGDGVISTYSEAAIPQFFPAHGYEVLNGTSQSAPHVTGLVALIKGKFPRANRDLVMAMVYAGSRQTEQEGHRFSQYGLINISDALEQRSPVVMKPIWKKLKQLPIGGENNQFVIKLPIKNFGINILEAQVEVNLLSNNAIIEESSFKLVRTSHRQTKMILIKGRIKDNKLDSKLPLSVSIKIDDQVDTFRHDINLITNIDTVVKTKSTPIEMNSSFNLQTKNANGKIIGVFETIIDKFEVDSFPSYFVEIKKETEGSFQHESKLHFFQTQGDKIVELPNPVVIESNSSILGVHKLDIDYDGVADFLIRAITQDEDGLKVRYLFRDKNLAPLFGDKSDWVYPLKHKLSYNPNTGDYQYILLEPKNMFFIAKQIDFLNNKKIALPHFITKGGIPHYDQKLKAHERTDKSHAKRIYQFSPELINNQVVLKAHALLSKEARLKILKKNRKSYLDELIVHKSIPQTKEEFYSSSAQIIFSVGRFMRRVNSTILINNEGVNFSTEIVTQNLIAKTNLSKVSNVNSDVKLSALSSSESIYEMNLTLIDSNAKKLSSYNFNDIDKENTYNSLLAIFSDKDEQSVFINRRRTIDYHLLKEGEVIQSLNKEVQRFSFLTGKVLNELYFPVKTTNEQKVIGSIYINGTQLTTDRIQVLRPYKNQLISPIRYSVTVPPLCTLLNPQQLNNEYHSYQFLCRDPQNSRWIIKQYPLN